MTPFERWSVWVTSLLTTLTGLVYLWMKYFLETTDPWSVVNHPLQPVVLKLHIVTAPLLVFAVGVITTRHVWRHFRSGIRWGRRTGIALGLLIGPMILTGYLIQAVTHQGWLRAIAFSHIGFGAVYAVGLAAHQLMIQRGNGAAQNGRAAAAPLTAASPPPVPERTPVPDPASAASVPSRRSRFPDTTP